MEKPIAVWNDAAIAEWWKNSNDSSFVPPKPSPKDQAYIDAGVDGWGMSRADRRERDRLLDQSGK
jgi:hypothetical protein